MTKEELLEEISVEYKEVAAKFIDECIEILDKHKCYYDKEHFSWGNLLLGLCLYAELRPYTDTEVYYYFSAGRNNISFSISHAVEKGVYEKLAEFQIPRK